MPKGLFEFMLHTSKAIDKTEERYQKGEDYEELDSDNNNVTGVAAGEWGDEEEWDEGEWKEEATTEEQVVELLNKLGETNPELKEAIKGLDVVEVRNELEKGIREAGRDKDDRSFSLGKVVNELIGISSAEANPIVVGAAAISREVIKKVLPNASKIAQDIATGYIKDFIKAAALGENDHTDNDNTTFEKKNNQKNKDLTKGESQNKPLAKGVNATSGGMEPDEDPEGEKDRKFGVNKAKSKVWKDLQPYRDNIKTNGLKGGDKKYYQWDHLHNEIEMYDSNRKPVDALDPITGKRLFKDVSKHRLLKL